MNKKFFTALLTLVTCFSLQANKPREKDPRLVPQIQLEPNLNHVDRLEPKELAKILAAANRIKKQRKKDQKKLRHQELNNVNL